MCLYFHPLSFRTICDLCVVFLALIHHRGEVISSFPHEANGCGFNNIYPVCWKHNSHLHLLHELVNVHCFLQDTTELCMLSQYWSTLDLFQVWVENNIQSSHTLITFFTWLTESKLKICNWRHFNASMLMSSTPNITIRGQLNTYLQDIALYTRLLCHSLSHNHSVFSYKKHRHSSISFMLLSFSWQLMWGWCQGCVWQDPNADKEQGR